MTSIGLTCLGVNIGAATHKLSSYNAQAQMSRGLFLARLWSFREVLVFNLGKTHTSNHTPTFSFFSPTQSHLNPAPIPKPMPSVFGTVSMFLRVSPRPWLNTVLGCVCVCVVQEPVSQSPNIPPHPFAPSAGKGGAWRDRKDRAQQFRMPRSPSQFFSLDQGTAGDGGTCMSRCPERVHRDRRGSVSGLLQLGSPAGVGP